MEVVSESTTTSSQRASNQKHKFEFVDIIKLKESAGVGVIVTQVT